MSNWWPRHDDDEIEAVTRVLRSGKTNYWTGGEGQAFEREYAAFVGVPHAIAVSNGTTALEAALRALRLPPGSEVIVPCRTFVACAAACVTVGLVPVLADVGAELNVTPYTVRARFTERTGAVMVVHYAGLPVAGLDEIVEDCRARRVSVIEDCAHAHGAAVGVLGDIATWSFCQGKIISTGGEGGMITTASGVLAERVRAFRDHGRFQMVGNPDTAGGKEFEYTVKEFGSNLRMTEMQSSIGRVQLGKLPQWRARRQEIARRYDAVTGGSVAGARITESAVYMYLWRARTPGEAERLAAAYGNARTLRTRLLEGVTEARYGGCKNIGYEPVFMRRAAKCSDADALGADIISLPAYPTMTDQDVDAVIAEVKAVMK